MALLRNLAACAACAALCCFLIPAALLVGAVVTGLAWASDAFAGLLPEEVQL